MSTGGVILLIIGIVVVLIALTLIVSYNRFVSQRNLVTESWRQIDVELKRRYDLIPNLIETVKAFASHERQVFESVVQARTAAQQVNSGGGINAAQQSAAEKNLGGALGRLFAVAENYPQLRSNENFVGLQREMTDTEDRIAAGRRFYNGNVRALNTRVEAFPSNIISGTFKFQKEQYFELDEPAARQSVRADFSSLTGNGPSSREVYAQPGDFSQYQSPPAALQDQQQFAAPNQNMQYPQPQQQNYSPQQQSYPPQQSQNSAQQEQPGFEQRPPSGQFTRPNTGPIPPQQ
ncbi:MAG: LemA family protein [Antricoccus sp.]